MYGSYVAKAEECWGSGGVRVWLVQDEGAKVGGASVPTPQCQLRKETGVLIRSWLQVPPSVSLQGVSWFLDGSDLEIQATEVLPRRRCQAPQTITPSASAALRIHLLTMVLIMNCLHSQSLPWTVLLQCSPLANWHDLFL